MKFLKLEELARGLTEQEMADCLKGLVTDNRFAAVLRLIQQQKELASDAACQLKFAEQPGCLAHAAGVRYAMLELEGRIRGVCEPPKKRGQQTTGESVNQ